MTVQQTATFEDQLYREDSIGTLLIEQFRNNDPRGRNRRFVESAETSDPSDMDGERLLDNKEDKALELPLLWHESSYEQGEGIVLQKWEGVALSVSDNSFCARLHDLTASNPEEEAEFSIEDVAEDDRGLVQPGAVFYWSIGYYTSRTGQKLRYSIVKFRRVPGWRTGEIKVIKKKAQELGRALGWSLNEESASSAG